ncbi:hypothetical protein MKZ38_004173 [Zalerion maritima]|uniref:Uncharacterized protein n=1 Tax=Zalerion maritima TaxID=339359 RepID=A0AAD5RMW0_9PEZI|nr:hypothetical protein MKZ38_004173 [Zalerion maritima]
MAQGAPKKLGSKPTPKPKGLLKKGAKVLKPKTKKANKTVNSQKIRKQFSSGIITRTEALLGERAGHLEMIGKGKKGKAKDKNAKGSRQTGGTRKFG